MKPRGVASSPVNLSAIMWEQWSETGCPDCLPLAFLQLFGIARARSNISDYVSQL
jgi:hypothetical protein